MPCCVSWSATTWNRQMISDSARATPGQGEGVTNRLRMSTVGGLVVRKLLTQNVDMMTGTFLRWRHLGRSFFIEWSTNCLSWAEFLPWQSGVQLTWAFHDLAEGTIRGASKTYFPSWGWRFQWTSSMGWYQGYSSSPPVLGWIIQ